MKLSTKFVPEIRHAFDLPNLRRMRQAVNALLNGHVVIGSAPQVHYANGNTVWEVNGNGGSVSIRGEYDPTAVYNKNDFAVISLGLNQGTFVALKTVTGIAPYTGGANWMQLPGGLLGAWF